MGKNKNQTLHYYNQTAKKFIQGTIDADLSALHERFFKHLPKNAHILDLGCGSGRDAKAFLEAGYTVVALDGSESCCQLAETYIGQSVVCQSYDQLDFENEFDGIWACASLLHLPFTEMTETFLKIYKALKFGGFFYASFKYGEFEGERSGRYFTDLTEERLFKLLKPIKGLEVIEIFVTSDVRDGREEEKWLNVMAKKV